MFRRTKKVVRGTIKAVRIWAFIANVTRVVKWFRSASQKKEKAQSAAATAKKSAPVKPKKTK